jgi:CheY-like chemotaxis protein
MPKILIVEDELSQRKILHDTLVQKGFQVIEATNGLEGLKTALKERPDIILSDVRMPKMDGITMMHKLREDSWGKNASIIILTNYDTNDQQLIQVTIDLPAFYLLKVNNPLEKILDKIQTVLASKEPPVSGRF